MWRNFIGNICKIAAIKISMCYYKDKKKMPFTDEVKIVIRHCILDKGFGVKKLLNEFSNKNWSKGDLDHF